MMFYKMVVKENDKQTRVFQTDGLFELRDQVSQELHKITENFLFSVIPYSIEIYRDERLFKTISFNYGNK